MDIRTEKIDIISMLKDIFREWWVILLVAVSVSLLSSVWVNRSYRPEYTASTTFVVTAKGMNVNIYQNLTTATELANRFSQVLESNVLKRKVAEDLGMDKFNARMSVQVLPETNLMELTVTADSAMEAFHIIKSIMENYNSVSDYVIENVILEVIQPPAIPMTPSNPVNVRSVMKKVFLLAAGILILLFGALSYLKDTVKNEREVSEKVDARLLGTIYHERKIKSLRQIGKAGKLSMRIENPLLSFRFVESSRMAASRIGNHMKKHGQKVLLVTSVTENEGKSTVAANLSLALAQENNRVLLIDCDFRKPSQYKIFDEDEKDRVDLPAILKNDVTAGDIVKRQEPSGLYTVFNHVAEEAQEELLKNRVLETVLEYFRGKMDYIILDTSPIALVSDAEELAQFADASLVVIRQDAALAKDINDVIDGLNRTRGKVLGCILNDAVPGFTENVRQYGSHYGYGGKYGKRAE